MLIPEADVGMQLAIIFINQFSKAESDTEIIMTVTSSKWRIISTFCNKIYFKAAVQYLYCKSLLELCFSEFRT